MQILKYDHGHCALIKHNQLTTCPCHTTYSLQPLATHLTSGSHILANYNIPSICYSVQTSLSISSQNRHKSTTHYIGTIVHKFSRNL